MHLPPSSKADNNRVERKKGKGKNEVFYGSYEEETIGIRRQLLCMCKTKDNVLPVMAITPAHTKIDTPPLSTLLCVIAHATASTNTMPQLRADTCRAEGREQ